MGLKWEFNSATGAYLAKVDTNKRLVRIGKGLYIAEYWGDYSLKYPVRSGVCRTVRSALEALQDIAEK